MKLTVNSYNNAKYMFENGYNGLKKSIYKLLLQDTKKNLRMFLKFTIHIRGIIINLVIQSMKHQVKLGQMIGKNIVLKLKMLLLIQI